MTTPTKEPPTDEAAAAPTPTNDAQPVPTATAESRPPVTLRSELTAAATVQVNLALVRRVGADTALAFAVMTHIGAYDYQRIAAATGMRRNDVRIHYARLIRFGVLKPVASTEEHMARLGIAPEETPGRGDSGITTPAAAGEGTTS